MEAWRRALDEPVSAFPITRAGPAHVATLKTYDPPLRELDGRRLAGARRRAKRLLFPTEDGELVVLVHLMTAGRLRYLRFGEKGPKTPAFQLVFEGGARLVLTEAGSKKRAGVWLLSPEAAEAELAHLGPEALGLGVERLAEICADESRRLHSLLRDQKLIAGIGRAWANEILHAARLSPYALSQDLDGDEVEALAAAVALFYAWQAVKEARAVRADDAYHRELDRLQHILELVGSVAVAARDDEWTQEMAVAQLRLGAVLAGRPELHACQKLVDA